MVSTRRTPKKSRSPSPAPRKSTPCAPLPLLVSRSAALRAVLRAPPSAARRSRASRKKKAATAPGRELIGAAISVHWEAEKCAPQPAHRAHGAGADRVAGLLRLLLALTARRAGNGTLEPCLSTTRAAGPTPSTTMMCVPRPALFCCVSLPNPAPLDRVKASFTTSARLTTSWTTPTSRGQCPRCCPRSAEPARRRPRVPTHPSLPSVGAGRRLRRHSLGWRSGLPVHPAEGQRRRPDSIPRGRVVGGSEPRL